MWAKREEERIEELATVKEGNGAVEINQVNGATQTETEVVEAGEEEESDDVVLTVIVCLLQFINSSFTIPSACAGHGSPGRGILGWCCCI